MECLTDSEDDRFEKEGQEYKVHMPEQWKNVLIKTPSSTCHHSQCFMYNGETYYVEFKWKAPFYQLKVVGGFITDPILLGDVPPDEYETEDDYYNTMLSNHIFRFKEFDKTEWIYPQPINAKRAARSDTYGCMFHIRHMMKCLKDDGGSNNSSILTIGAQTTYCNPLRIDW